MADSATEANAAGAESRRHGPGSVEDEGPRKIVLFSDGTGNSSAKLQRTNVWRLYEALDLGYPVDTGKSVQIAYYDDGVGTSSVKLLAALGGAFGFGLARNVRDIYKFLCRNYREGDQIYAFGFSRGAYTIRLLVAFITTMGLVPYRQDEEQLDLATRDNWREFRRAFHANNFIADFLVGLGRWAVRTLITVKRRLLGQLAYASCTPGPRRNWLAEWWQTTRDRWIGRWTGNPPIRPEAEYGPDVEFVGVWDTVAAYGGPIVEITRAIDEWIWPMTMPNYRLSERVKAARHALAIDDKRDAFTPLPWDEVHERDLAERYRARCGGAASTDPRDIELCARFNDPASPRLQQVWFAGMHSDVGGGYSDDSLAYVSLWWMIEHAEQGGSGIRLLPEYRDRIATFRNIYGTIHDSRGGSGAFYRYQPRYINAWVDGRPGSKILPGTQIYRDPTIDHGRYRNRGLLAFPIRLHRSVEERLHMATDGYAPNNLPARYIVDDGPAGTAAPATTPLSHDNPADQPSLANLAACMDRLSSHTKLRRFWYFVSAWIAAAIALKPVWPHIPVLKYMVGSVDARTDAHALEQAANAFVPSFAHIWTSAIAADPFVSLLCFGALVAAGAIGVSQERQMAEIAGRMWRQRLTPGAPISPPFRLHLLDRIALAFAGGFYRSNTFASVLAWAKWRAVPQVLGFFVWVFNWYVAAIVVTQLSLVPREAMPSACAGKPLEQQRELRDGKLQVTAAVVDIAVPCTDTGLTVTSVGRDSLEKHYKVTIEARDATGKPGPWLDAGQPATPEGWTETGALNTVTQWFAWPLQRVTTGKLMQPVFEVRRNVEHWPFDDIYMMRPVLTKSADNTWTGELIIPRRPENDRKEAVIRNLHAFVNDDSWPVDRVGANGKPGVDAQGNPVCAVPDADGWWAALRSLALFPMSGRYRNNCGQMRITLEELP